MIQLRPSAADRLLACGRIIVRARFAARAGFTLIEVAVVVTLLALVGTMALLRFASPLRRVQLEADCHRAKEFDAAVRQEAVRTRQRASLIVDLDANELSWREAGGNRSAGGSLSFLGANIERVRLTRREITRGRVALTVSDDGSSPTYALLLASGPVRHWIVIVGGTGQVLEALDDHGVQEIFRWHRLQGADAH